MTKEERLEMQELGKAMMYDILTKEQENRYWELSAKSYQEYYEENEPLIKAWYNENLKGKKVSEVPMEDLEFYSDWYKDVYGHRPRFYMEVFQ